jgi:RNA polymerase sigma-70 factor (ECF subfamily)
MTKSAALDQSIPVAYCEPADMARPEPKADLRELSDTHAPFVWNTLRRLGVREGDLEDLTHDVFVQVQRHLGEYDATRPARPWLFGFAFRIASQHRRRAHHRREVQREAEAADPAARPDEQLAAEQDRRLVLDALEGIHADRRPVFVLYEIDGMPMDEIARVLGIPVNTAYSRLRVARAEFAAAVRRLRPKRRGEA